MQWPEVVWLLDIFLVGLVDRVFITIPMSPKAKGAVRFLFVKEFFQSSMLLYAFHMYSVLAQVYKI